MKVGPVAVVQIACQQHKVDFFGQSQIHQILQRPAGGVAQALYRRTGIAAQAAQRAVDVQIGGVEEAESARNLCRGRYYVIHST